MATQPAIERRQHNPALQERLETGVAKPLEHGTFRSLGLGLITGASDDDPSAIGTQPGLHPVSLLSKLRSSDSDWSCLPTVTVLGHSFAQFFRYCRYLIKNFIDSSLAFFA
jgi:hypothetical protein